MRGDFVVRFHTQRSRPGGGNAIDVLGSMKFKEVDAVVHASGALEIAKPATEDAAREVQVIYGPGMWQSITPLAGDGTPGVHDRSL